MAITYRETGEVDFAQALALYRALRWSSAEKPRELERALRNSLPEVRLRACRPHRAHVGIRGDRALSAISFRRARRAERF